MGIKVERLIYLKDILKYGSISAAAEHNFMTQPALSKEIKKLEHELGVELLTRGNNKVTPTKAYYQIEKQIDIVLETLKDIESICKKIGQDEAKLSVGINLLMNDDFLQPVIDYMCHAENLKIDFSIVRLNNDDIFEALLAKRINFGIAIDWEDSIKKSAKKSLFCFRQLFEDDITICLSEKMWDPSKQTISIDEFLKISQITFSNNQPVENELYYRMFGAYPLVFRHVNDLNLAIDVLLKGHYCLMTLKSCYEKNIKVNHPEICGLGLGDFEGRVPVYLIYAKDRVLTTDEEDFMTYLNAHMKI